MRTRIITAVREGHFKETAAGAAGIAQSTLYDWLDRGRTEREAGLQSVYAEFSEAIALAEQQSEEELFGRVLAAAKPKGGGGADWALRVLKLKNRGRYADTTKIEHSGSIGGGGARDLAAYTDDELAKLEEIQTAAEARRAAAAVTEEAEVGSRDGT